MAKSNRRTKHRETAPPPAPRPSKDVRLAKENGRLVGLSIIAGLVSIIVSVPVLSTLFTTAPVVPPLVRRVRQGKQAPVTGAFLRWAATIFLTVLVSAAFVNDRVMSSFPFAAKAAGLVEQALAGSGGAQAGFIYMANGLLAFIVLSAVSFGIAGCLLGSVALATAAAVSATLYTHGNNIILTTLIALPPWQWALFAAATLAFAPAAIWGGSKLYKIRQAEFDRGWLKRRAIIVAGLFVLALVLRLAVAGPYLDLVRHWSVY